MDYLFQKVSYLQGFADGLNLDEGTSEGKILVQIIDILADFVEALDEVAENQVDLEDYVNFIDEDLSDLEDEVYGLDEDYQAYEDYDDFDDDFELDVYDECCGDEECECHCEEDE